MSSQPSRQQPTALGLLDHCIYMAPREVIRPFPKTAELFRSAQVDPELADGRVLLLHHANGPQDVHYPDWEMHPAGDELLVLVSGALSVELREPEQARMERLQPHAALIVPAGIWHRLVVHEPCVLIAITPRHDTVHEKG
jgi:mannose-6-phosphate isomerase-like protein (cupin superfamily)